jgi:hypothetical protein
MAAGTFAVRSIMFWAYWNDPHHRAQSIEPWMTAKYISHSWAVPPEVVLDAIGAFDRTKTGPMNLDQIAKAQNQPLEALITKIEAAVQSFDHARPALTAPAPKDVQ